MIGLVLAAGAGRRLQPLTNELPKALLPVSGERTILDIALGNLREVGIDEVVLVTGFAAQRIEERVDDFERRYGVNLHTVYNDKAEEWNNAYSLWVARQWFGEGALLINGDTVHPPAVEERLLEARGADILLAVDDGKPLAEEEMKVVLDSDGMLAHINKAVDPTVAAGEYIGVTLIEPGAAGALTSALETTWSTDPSLYYEDGYQEFVNQGGSIAVTSIGAADWVEVDDHTDLVRAREVACHYLPG
ncbi:phosphocholine cytidylyltransferase family protein [Haloechinothrix sp. YIM 98757]|uniref:Phosphocholine cytidylyltransferase family protein n=1 Tax=Haloechinothrix aidingensis TaxID=2752311 RepID=A0A837ZYH0_9PSEU|nr:phosphocholine cytidylyltransferase family protein [Haloechinothrix aidingensis]MBA0125234.1 phosphocholine cytidylyltransferase family protein [Haloechinothrix aidingensis]